MDLMELLIINLDRYIVSVVVPQEPIVVSWERTIDQVKTYSVRALWLRTRAGDIFLYKY